jgi:prolyl 4-hydroxylase
MVIYLEDFLQPGEADHMIEIAKPKMTRSRVIGDAQHSEARTSSSAYLERSQDNIVKCIEERASLFSNISVESTEPLQVVWYKEGQEFRPHHDYLLRQDLKNDYWSRFGQRYTTFLVYLNEPTEGGGTLFSTLGFELEPKKNAAVFWYNVDHTEKEDIRTMHGGSPVKGGEKYAINIWQRKMLPDLDQFIQKPEQDTDDQPPKEAPKYAGN